MIDGIKGSQIVERMGDRWMNIGMNEMKKVRWKKWPWWEENIDSELNFPIHETLHCKILMHNQQYCTTKLYIQLSHHKIEKNNLGTPYSIFLLIYCFLSCPFKSSEIHTPCECICVHAGAGTCALPMRRHFIKREGALSQAHVWSASLLYSDKTWSCDSKKETYLYVH